jgi:hypothetical protein
MSTHIGTKIAVVLCMGGALLLMLVQNQRLERRLAALDARLASLGPPPAATTAPSEPRIVYGQLARQVADEVLRRQPKPSSQGPGDSIAPPGSGRQRDEAVAATEEGSRRASLEALHQANVVLDGAAERGQLTRDDVQEMREYVAGLSDASEANPLRSRIAQLLNSNRLRVQDPAFIYP